MIAYAWQSAKSPSQGIDETPDEEWAVDLGEIGTNARAALDHLVYQLAIDNGSDPSKGSRTQFPIFLDEPEYRRGGNRSHRERMLKGA